MTKQMTVELPDGVSSNTQWSDVGATLSLHIDTLEAADELIERVKVAKVREAVNRATERMLSASARPAGMPEDGKPYFYFSADGEKYSDYWQNKPAHARIIHVGRWEIGNVFLTEAECLAEIERRKALQRVKVWIAENTEPLNGTGLIDYRHVYYDGLEKHFAFEYHRMRLLISEVPMLREHDVERLIAACESDLRILAGL